MSEGVKTLISELEEIEFETKINVGFIKLTQYCNDIGGNTHFILNKFMGSLGENPEIWDGLDTQSIKTVRLSRNWPSPGTHKVEKGEIGSEICGGLQ